MATGAPCGSCGGGSSNDYFAPLEHELQLLPLNMSTPEKPRTRAGTGRRTNSHPAVWAKRLLWFLRVMAVVSMLNGLRYWAAVCGFAFVPQGGFEAQAIAWQTATVFFAVIDLVAAVGLWLAAPWGAVVWLTSAVSMVVIEVVFPEIYDDHFLV